MVVWDELVDEPPTELDATAFWMRALAEGVAVAAAESVAEVAVVASSGRTRKAAWVEDVRVSAKIGDGHIVLGSCMTYQPLRYL